MSEYTAVSYGGGTNSTALLVECVKRSIPVDLILFADTGGERPHTYVYIEIFSKWLVDKGYPEIITVVKGGIEETLEGNCLRKNMLPSLAYGFKSCSQKFKIGPQDKFCNNHQPIKDVWKSGRKVKKLIGFDADEPHRVKDYTSDKYIVEYPLVDWDMGREECIQSIKEAGLCLPGKSACFFCPASKKAEILELRALYPELADRAIRMEENAELTKIKGLGRSFSWKNLLATGDMFAENYIEIDCGCYDG